MDSGSHGHGYARGVGGVDRDRVGGEVLAGQHKRSPCGDSVCHRAGEVFLIDSLGRVIGHDRSELPRSPRLLCRRKSRGDCQKYSKKQTA